MPPEDVEAHAIGLEEQLTKAEEGQAAELEAAEENAAASAKQEVPAAQDRLARPET